MAATGKLKALTVSKATRRGYLNDGGGLYLRIAPGGTKSWVFRFRVEGRLREMGIGSADTLSLVEAREKARECRKLRLDGKDPIEVRKSDRQRARLEAARAMTFRECAEAYIAAHHDSWKNAKHAAQWPSTLKTYAYPIFGDLPVQSVDVDLIIKVIEPIWKAKTETASRLRGRIEAVLDWATVRKFRQGENPARWRGHLDHLLPERGKLQKVEHHAALPYAELPGFMVELREQEGVAARALEFTILTVARTGEVIGAWADEIVVAERLWTVPAERMKAGKEHRVPLSDATVAILKKMQGEDGDFVFPGAKPQRPLSNMAMTMVLRRMGRGNITVHGFRSTFSDWCSERTNFPAEVREMALAHAVSDKVEAAYRRGDLFEKRRQLAEAWARYCAAPARPASNIVSLHQSVAAK
jgi:integrase